MVPNLIRVALGPLDHFAPRTYPAGVVYLGMKDGVNAAEVFADLQEGLHRAFLQVPWLNGKVHWQSRDTPGWRPGQLEIRYSPIAADGPRPYQLRFNELESATPYADIKASGFPINAFKDEGLLWAPFRADIDAGAEVLVAQANFMPGACLLALSICHLASDATGTAAVLKLWGDNCRSLHSQDGAASVMLLPPESSDRTLLDSIWAKEVKGHSVSQIDPATWQLVGLNPPNANGHDDQINKPSEAPPASANPPQAVYNSQRVMKSKIFYMSPAAFTALRKECIEELGTTDVSGNDVVLALIWRSLMKVRTAAMQHTKVKTEHEHEAQAGQGTTLVEIQVPVDGRPDFSQSMLLPARYLGNLNFHHRPTLPLAALVAPDTSIASVAQTIRTSARNIHHATMLDAYSLLRAVPDYGRTQPLRFLSLEGTLLISSMLMVPDDVCFSDAVFCNDGRPEAYRPLMGARNSLQFRLCYIFPRKKYGGIEFMVSLLEDELDFLLEDEEFGRYAFLLA